MKTESSPEPNAPADSPPADGQQPMGATGISLTLLTCALWGGTPTAIRYTVDTLPPIFVAAIRFAQAVVFMGFWCRLRGERLRLRREEWIWPTLLGVMLCAQISLFNLGIDWSNASHGTLLINTFIFWVVGIEHLAGRERIGRFGWVGILLAAAGVGLILRIDRIAPVGDVMLLMSAAILGVKILITKRATRHVEPGPLIFWHDVVGTLGFFAISAATETVSASDFTPPAIWGVIYQGVFVAGICFIVQAELLKRHPASQIAIYSFTTPLFGMAFAIGIRGEPATPWLAVSACCVAGGIWLVNQGGKSVDR